MNKSTAIDILGTKLSVLNYNTILGVVQKRIRGNASFICVASVHSLMESLADKSLQYGMNKSLFTTTDGMPLVWISRFVLKRKVERVYGPTLMLKICKLAQRNGFKVFLLGGLNGLGQTLKLSLNKKYPGIRIVGFYETPIRPPTTNQNKDIIKKIKISNADIVFVGLGCPYQEIWMIKNYKKFSKGLFVGVGAAFDFISGRVKQTPPYLQPLGMEWFHRMMREPRRLWKRYLITNFRFVFTVLPRYKYFHEIKTTLS